FRLLCLQTHALLKYRLDTQAMNSIQRAKDLLEKIDPSEFSQGNTRDNFLYNNPHSSNIFYDRGYLSGDMIYLLFLEIIQGMHVNTDNQQLKELITEGLSLTKDNHPYAIEFIFLSRIIENKFFTFNEISDLKNQLNLDSIPFFCVMSKIISKNTSIIGESETIDRTLVEDLEGMSKELKTNNTISHRIYRELPNLSTKADNFDLKFIENIHFDEIGRQIEDTYYTSIFSKYFSGSPANDIKIIFRLQFLANIALDLFFEQEYKKSLNIFLYLKNELSNRNKHLINIFQPVRIKFLKEKREAEINKEKFYQNQTLVDLGLIYYFIGLIYFNMNKYSEAHEYLKLGLIENLSVKERDMGIIYILIGNIFYNQAKYKDAIKCFSSSQFYIESFGFIEDKLIYRYNLISALIKNMEFDKANISLNELRTIAIDLNNMDYLTLIRDKQAEIETYKENYETSIQLLYESLEHWNMVKNTYQTAHTFFRIYFISEKIGLSENSTELLQKWKIFEMSTNKFLMLTYQICLLYDLQKRDTKLSNETLYQIIRSLNNYDLTDEFRFVGLAISLFYIKSTSSPYIHQQSILLDAINKIDNNDLKTKLYEVYSMIIEGKNKKIILNRIYDIVFKNLLLLFNL
ncbi:MAG: hypothetical protein OEY49_19445, partial [Candidatus Heimdallarchaeota archaeon]|nr:hypothetical protein [Candidatus Heimdallarchaeota archaeon]